MRQHTTKSVVSSPEFGLYADGYLMEPNVFFSALAAWYSETGFSLRDFIEPRGNWPAEEVIVPRAVGPQYLLGYRSGGVWHPWRKPMAHHVAERLEELVSLWKSPRAR
jgi:hypothetical protein